MGYRCCWVAAKGVDLDAALSAMGLVHEEDSDEGVYDPGHYAVVMPGGWLVVIGDGRDALGDVQPEHAQQLSAGTEALHFFCDDTPMCASLAAYRDGREVWSLDYDGSDGVSTPELTGEVPAVAREIIERCLATQRESGDEGVDHVYELAPELGLELTGFRHDRTLADGEHLPISILARACVTRAAVRCP